MADGGIAWPQPLLSQQPILHSGDADEVRTRIASLFNDHVLRTNGPALSTRLHGIETASIGLWLLQYGADVMVEETHADGDHVLVQLPLAGEVVIESTEGRWKVAPGMGLVLPPSARHRLYWRANASQAILRIPWRHLQIEHARLTGERAGQPLALKREINLQASEGAQWSALLRYFCEQIAQPDVASAGPRLELAQEALLRHLLCVQLPSSNNQPGAGVNGLPLRLQRAQHYMLANLHNTPSLAAIAQHAGLSTRSLTRLWQEYFATSPAQWLRRQRLDLAHRQLSHALAGANVAQIALHCGFNHLGRFAAEYYQRFGELPGQTLQNNRQVTKLK